MTPVVAINGYALTIRALLGSVASDPTYYSGGTGSSPVSGDGFSERFPLSRLYWYQGLRRVRIPCGNGTVSVLRAGEI